MMVQPKKVLVVEDEKDLSAVFVNILNTFGFNSTVAETGEVAKNSLKSDNFDFLIIDITLPDQTGLELYKQIISTNPFYKGNVIFTSGATASEELKTIIEKDGITFLSKPFSINEFKQVLDRWI